MTRSMVVFVALLGVVVSGQRGGAQPRTAGRARQAGGARESHTAAPDHRGSAQPGRARPHDRRSGRRGQELQGHLFVFTRSGNAGPGHAAPRHSQLFEFDPSLKFVKQWGPDNYAASFAHTVRVDKDDNVWMTDEGSNMIVKFNPQGQVAMVLGRKPEAHRLPRALHRARRAQAKARPPSAAPGTFNRPTDVTWDTRGQHLRGRRLQQLARRQDRRRTARG